MPTWKETARMRGPSVEGGGMLRAVSEGMALVVVVLGVSIALVGVPAAETAVPAAWLVVVAGLLYFVGVLGRTAWMAWLGIGVLAVYAVLVQPSQWVLFLPFVLLMALSLVLMATRPVDLPGAPHHR